MSSTEERKRSSRRRRLRETFLPLISAGLLKFPETREYYKVRLDPKTVVFISIAIIAVILILDLTVPLTLP